jgi:hypothetical protein
MSTPINDGGPAFPMQDMSAIHAYAVAKLEGITDTEERDRVYQKARAEAVGGISARDWFAGQALAGWTSSQCHVGGLPLDGSEEHATKIAQTVYRYADAMLAARNPQEDTP